MTSEGYKERIRKAVETYLEANEEKPKNYKRRRIKDRYPVPYACRDSKKNRIGARLSEGDQRQDSLNREIGERGKFRSGARAKYKRRR